MSDPRLSAKFKLEGVRDMRATLTLTMPICDWEQLDSQLSQSPRFTSFPSWRVCELIQQLVRQAKQEFEAEGEDT